MDVVFIGVSDRSSLWRHGKIKEKDYEKLVDEYSTFLAEHFRNAIVTPDDGVYTDLARALAKKNGLKPIGYIPNEDTNYGYEHLKKNFDDFDIKPIGGDWYKLDAELTTKSDVVVCFGLSPGTLIELSYVKWNQKSLGLNTHVFICKQSIDCLPGTFVEQIKNLYFFSSVEELEKQLQETGFIQ